MFRAAQRETEMSNSAYVIVFDLQFKKQCAYKNGCINTKVSYFTTSPEAWLVHKALTHLKYYEVSHI